MPEVGTGMQIRECVSTLLLLYGEGFQWANFLQDLAVTALSRRLFSWQAGMIFSLSRMNLLVLRAL